MVDRGELVAIVDKSIRTMYGFYNVELFSRDNPPPQGGRNSVTYSWYSKGQLVYDMTLNTY